MLTTYDMNILSSSERLWFSLEHQLLLPLALQFLELKLHKVANKLVAACQKCIPVVRNFGSLRDMSFRTIRNGSLKSNVRKVYVI